MAISAQVFVPYFSSAYPSALTTTLRVFAPSLSQSYAIPVDLTTTDLFFIRNGVGSNSLAKKVVDTLNNTAAPGFPAGFAAVFGTWSFTTTSAVSAIGFASQIGCSLPTNFRLTFGIAGDFDWRWLGLPLAVTSITPTASPPARILSATTFPAGTWFPQVRANDLGMLPSPAQVSFSSMTADGSVAVVDMSGDPTLLPQWWTLYLDGTLGVHGARMQRYRTAKPAWAAAIGVATDAPFCALDYPGGWWSYAVRGTPFVVGDQAVDDQTVGPLRIHASGECPEGMDPIRGLRAPTVTRTAATGGRRDLKLAFLYGGQ
jgi:hypothetical protein